MDESELIREATAALGDLGDLAPKPPSLTSITAGYAPLRRIEPRKSRWRLAAALAGAAAVTILVVGVAALVGSGLGGNTAQTVPVGTPDQTGESIYGTWVLVSYTYESETHTVEAATVENQKPTAAWIEIGDDGVTGNTGCNSFEGNDAPQLDAGVLVFGEVFATAVGCLDETSEPAFLEALWSGPGGVSLSIDNETMAWTTDMVELVFERRDRRPIPPPLQWSTGFDRLECSPSAYLTENLSDTGVSLTDALLAIPGVESVEEGEPFWWGLNASGTVIVGAAIGDIDPPVIERSACAESFGLRPEADLGAASYTWVNELGLAQTSPLVWSTRFIELCATNTTDLSPFATQYVDEDSEFSVRADGTIPTLDEAVQALEVIQRSTCAATKPVIDDTSADSTTTSITSLNPSACSAADMDIPDDYPPSYSDLPEAVARTRAMLLDAALGCDLERIVEMAADGADEEYSDAIFWGAAGTLEGLLQYDGDNGSLLSLELALTSVPTAASQGERYDPETETTVPEVYYSWPPVHDDLGNGVGLEDVWDAETLKRVAALNNQSVADLVAFSNEFGAYAGFRVGIAEDGRWIFALAGD